VFLNGDIAEKVAEIKRQPGPKLNVWGSGNLMQTLLKHDLVDTFWLMIESAHLGRRETPVGRWHDPGSIPGDGEYGQFEGCHCCDVRAHGRDHNRGLTNPFRERSEFNRP
jgi:riboflavin biosynthesis pyrimidine reductase